MICPGCRLVFQTCETLPSSGEEQGRYDQHRNDKDDPGYTGYTGWLNRFLQNGVYPWYKGGCVLDFGSGPEPVLTDLLSKDGVETVPYDKFYQPLWPDGRLFSLIVLSEVLEHLADPVVELKKIGSVSKPGARLVFQTAYRKDNSLRWFESWWYKEDITHIRFYNAESLHALGEHSGWSLIYQDGASMGVFVRAIHE